MPNLTLGYKRQVPTANDKLTSNAKPEQPKKPCPFQHCCDNYRPNRDGICTADFEDILECWADNTDPKTLTKKELEGYCAFHGLTAEEALQ